MSTAFFFFLLYGIVKTRSFASEICASYETGNVKVDAPLVFVLKIVLVFH